MTDHILVSGGAGYIGAQTCKLLSQKGFTPVTLDNLSTGYAKAVRWGPLVEADIADAEAVLNCVRQYDIKAAIHFAAFSLAGESVSNPAKYYNNNVAKAIRFASALIEAGVSRFVFSSTAAVYGMPKFDLITEDHPKAPVNPYGASKLAFEGALHWLGQAHGLGHVILRYFNAAGADPDGEIGESHEPETHLIPNMCKAILGKGPQLNVFGTDYDTPDGTAIRDYIHVVDLAEAHLAALGYLETGGMSRAFNVGTGQGASIMEVMHAAEVVMGKPVPHTLGPRRAGDPPRLVADSSALRAALDWRPRLSDLNLLVKSAARWQADRHY